MGINKDKNQSATSYVVNLFENYVKPRLSQSDLNNYYELIAEINANGYYVQYWTQLKFADKDDIEIMPIIKKYINKMEDRDLKNLLYDVLGKSKSPLYTDFLLDEFRKPNIPNAHYESDDLSWNFTRRWAVSNALWDINDKSKQEDYIELLTNKETRNDCVFIIWMLGKMKSEKALPYLIETLSDKRTDLQSFAIKALGYYKKHPELIEIIKPFLKSEYPACREHARGSLKKLEKDKEKNDAKTKPKQSEEEAKSGG